MAYSQFKGSKPLKPGFTVTHQSPCCTSCQRVFDPDDRLPHTLPCTDIVCSECVDLFIESSAISVNSEKDPITTFVCPVCTYSIPAPDKQGYPVHSAILEMVLDAVQDEEVINTWGEKSDTDEREVNKMEKSEDEFTGDIDERAVGTIKKESPDGMTGQCYIPNEHAMVGYCQTCNFFLCEECSQVLPTEGAPERSHDHKTHSVMTAYAYWTDIKVKGKLLEADIKDQCEKLKRVHDNQKDHYKDQKQKLLQDISSSAESHISAVRSWQTKMESQLDVLMRQQTQQINLKSEVTNSWQSQSNVLASSLAESVASEKKEPSIQSLNVLQAIDTQSKLAYHNELTLPMSESHPHFILNAPRQLPDFGYLAQLKTQSAPYPRLKANNVLIVPTLTQTVSPHPVNFVNQVAPGPVPAVPTVSGIGSIGTQVKTAPVAVQPIPVATTLFQTVPPANNAANSMTCDVPHHDPRNCFLARKMAQMGVGKSAEMQPVTNSGMSQQAFFMGSPIMVPQGQAAFQPNPRQILLNGMMKLIKQEKMSPPICEDTISKQNDGDNSQKNLTDGMGFTGKDKGITFLGPSLIEGGADNMDMFSANDFPEIGWEIGKPIIQQRDESNESSSTSPDRDIDRGTNAIFDVSQKAEEESNSNITLAVSTKDSQEHMEKYDDIFGQGTVELVDIVEMDQKHADTAYIEATKDKPSGKTADTLVTQTSWASKASAAPTQAPPGQDENGNQKSSLLQNVKRNIRFIGSSTKPWGAGNFNTN